MDNIDRRTMLSQTFGAAASVPAVVSATVSAAPRLHRSVRKPPAWIKKLTPWLIIRGSEGAFPNDPRRAGVVIGQCYQHPLVFATGYARSWNRIMVEDGRYPLPAAAILPAPPWFDELWSYARGPRWYTNYPEHLQTKINLLYATMHRMLPEYETRPLILRKTIVG